MTDENLDLCMLILRYKYDLEDGTPRNVSCCLQEGQTYSIGRSSKNLLNIKNDKSISRNHISLTWQMDKQRVALNNQGKLTAAGGKYLKVGEDMIFEESIYKFKGIIVELGTKPIRVEISWKDVIWDIPNQFADLKRELSSFGIDVQVETADERSTSIVANENEAHRLLFGLVHKILLRPPQFLQESIGVLSSSKAEFDESWNRLETSPPMIMSPTSIREFDFSGLVFYSIGLKSKVLLYVKKAIEKAGGRFVPVENLQELLNFLRSENSAEGSVVIRSPNAKFELSNAGIESFTPDDIVESMQKDNLKKLLRPLPQLKQSSPKTEVPNVVLENCDNNVETKTIHPSDHQLDENPEKPPMKKRRLNRRTVKPLDSLMFFAGGESFKRESELHMPIPPVESVDETIPLPTTDNLNTETNSGPDVIILQPTPEKVEESPVTYATTTEQTAVEAVQEPVSRDVVNSISVNESTKDNDYELSNQDAVLQEQSAPDIGSIINTREAVRQRTLRDSIQSHTSQELSPKEDLVEVIKDVKNREVKRLNSTLIQVDSNELTEDAIHQLGNLVIVQPNESLLRDRQNKEVEQDAFSHQPWQGRKNFKTFMKIQPKYKSHQLGDKNREGSSDFIRNSAYLLTREYVPMKPYSEQWHRKAEEFPKVTRETPASPATLDEAQRARPEEQFTFTRHSSGPSPAQELFVVDEDDSQTTAQVQPEGHGAVDRDFEPADATPSHQDVSSMASGKRNASRDGSRLGMMNDYDNDDDDDDEGDDEPKFKFRRRMR